MNDISSKTNHNSQLSTLNSQLIQLSILNWNGILFAKTIFARFDRSYFAKNQKQNP